MRVLHLLTSLGRGGAEVWLMNLVHPLRQLGIEVGFVLKAPEYGGVGGLDQLAKSLSIPVHEVRLSVLHAGYLRGVARVAREGGYDIIQTHEFVYSGAGVLAGRLAGLPTVVTLHSNSYLAQTPQMDRHGIREVRAVYGRASVAYAVRRADAITALSRAVLERVVPSFATDPRCHQLRLCVDVCPRASEAERTGLRASLGWASTSPIVVHAGRFTREKNHEGILRVFRRVLQSRPDARLLLMGRGPLEGAVAGSADDLIRSGRVCLTGGRSDVPRVFAAADVCLFPSLEEGFGLAALEANASGLPVVGSRVAGLDEAIADGETGLLHDLDDEVGMARSVVDLLDNAGRAQELGLHGQIRAQELFSPRSSAALLANVYRGLTIS